jgi:KDO2-lipid IV(A) lauroyltransferase
LGAFRTAAYNYVDMFRIPAVSPQALLARTAIHHPERMLEAFAAGKGVVVCTAHFGNFDLLVQASQAYNMPVVALAERLEPPALFDFIVGLRSKYGLKVLPVGPGALREAVRTLKDGGVLAMAADRDLQGHGQPTRFFDADALLPSGPVDLAVATGAALLPTFGVRLPGGRYEIFFEEPLPLRREPGPEASAENRRMLIERVETMIARHPEQWIVFEPVWRNAAPDASDGG